MRILRKRIANRQVIDRKMSAPGQDEPPRRSITKPDREIRSSAEDLLGRKGFAIDIAEQIRSTDLSEGLVVGLIGPWGSGKTSLIRMMLEYLEQNDSFVQLDFNPWLFSSAEDLIRNFFLEVGARLAQKNPSLEQIAALWNSYGQYLAAAGSLPWVGAMFGVLAEKSKSTASAQMRDPGGLEKFRDEITAAMIELSTPILVVIDDIDRLESKEIRDIFRLVRLTGAFPNIVYLLAFDRRRVESALDEDNFVGRSYIEKIVQIPVDVPQPSAEGLQSQIVAAIENTLEGVDHPGFFDSERWPSVFQRIASPLFRNMRDVRRYQTAIAGTLQSLQGEVNLVDVLALEAIRIFRPDMFNGILDASAILVEQRSVWTLEREKQRARSTIEGFVSGDWEDSEIRRAVIELLFPLAERHLDPRSAGTEVGELIQANRVGYGMFLLLYCERTPSSRLYSYRMAKSIIAEAGSKTQILEYLHSLEPIRRRTLLESIEMVERDIPNERFPLVISALSEALNDIPDVRESILSLPNERVVSGLVGRRVCKAASSLEARALLEGVLAVITDLDYRYKLFWRFGEDARDPNCALSEADWNVLRDEMLADLHVINLNWLCRVERLGYLLLHTNQGATDLTPVIDRDATGALARNVLLSSIEAIPIVNSRSGEPFRRVADAKTLLGIFKTCVSAQSFLDRFADETDPEIVYALELSQSALDGACPENGQKA